MIRQLSETMNQNIKTADATKIYFGMHVKPPSVTRKLTNN